MIREDHPHPGNRGITVIAWGFLLGVAVMVLVVAGLFVAVVRAVAQTSPQQQECDSALNGTPVLAGIQRLGVAWLCEPRPAGAPPAAGGEYGEGTIHLWPDGISTSVLLKIAAHESGHAWSFQRPDLTAAWYALRGTSGVAGQEDFAESFYRANFPVAGLSFVQYGDSYASDAQLEVMRQWWEPWTSGSRGPSPVVGMTPADPAPLTPAVVPLPLAPAVEPRVEPLPLAPKESSAVRLDAPTLPPRVANLRVAVTLAALREAAA